jgi:hypothetical protein
VGVGPVYVTYLPDNPNPSNSNHAVYYCIQVRCSTKTAQILLHKYNSTTTSTTCTTCEQYSLPIGCGLPAACEGDGAGGCRAQRHTAPVQGGCAAVLLTLFSLQAITAPRCMRALSWLLHPRHLTCQHTRHANRLRPAV